MTSKTEIKNHLNISKNREKIMGLPLEELIKEYGLPLHLYYEPVIRRNVRAFKEVLKKYYPNSSVRYAAKANTHKRIFEIVKEEGAGSDVASFNEARCALEAGIKPEKLDLNGNCKRQSLLEEAIKKGILIVADSFEDFENIVQTAESLKIKPDVLLRISGYNLGKVTDASIFTSGTWTKFGAPLNEVPGFIKTILNYPQVNFLGFHTHIGSQIADVEPYMAVLGKMIEMGLLLKETGIPCKIINIGGGFPVSYVNKDEWDYIKKGIKEGYIASQKGDDSKIFAWDNGLCGFERKEDGSIDFENWTGEKLYTKYPKEKMLEAILTGEVEINSSKMSTTEALKLLDNPELVVEPGRSIVEDAGVTIAKVGFARKIAGVHNITTVEMGVVSNCDSLLEANMRQCELLNDFDKKDPEPFETFLGGNLCFSGDMIFKIKAPLQRKPQRGDLLMIYDTGAYPSTFMPANCNSFPRPPRILVYEDGSTWTLKRRDEYNEILEPDFPY